MSNIGDDQSQSYLADDWVDVQRFAQHSGCECTEEWRASSDLSTIAALLNLQDAQPDENDTATAVHGEQRGLQGMTAGTQAQPESQAALQLEIHLARAKARQTRRENEQAERKVTFLEDLMKEYKDEKEGADCSCLHYTQPAEHDDDAKSDNSDASSNVPSVVEDCFELDREAFVINERIIELDCEHREAEAMRLHNMRQDDRLIQTLEDPESLYRQRRRELVEALVIAHYRLYVRRNACLAEGIDPEQFRFRHG